MDTCSKAGQATWQVVRALGRAALEGRVSEAAPLPVLAASATNTALLATLAAFPATAATAVNPTAAPALATAAAALVAELGWTQLTLVTSGSASAQLAVSLASREICVVAARPLPSRHHHKDEYTELLAGVAATGASRVVVAGAGADIARLVRNVYELNLNMSVLALPWDGSVADMPGSDAAAGRVEILQLVKTFYNVPEFMAEAGQRWSYEHPATWPLVRAVYGLLELGEAGVAEEMARAGLGLAAEAEQFRVEQFQLRQPAWRTVAVCEDGSLTWTRAPLVTGAGGGCAECQCVNTAPRPALAWTHATWVTVTAATAGAGLLGCGLVAAFLCRQCGAVLEGGLATTAALLAATALTYLAVLPFCLLPSSAVCLARELAPPAVYTLLLAATSARSLLLATADTDGLPGHASGWLQLVLGAALVAVEAAVVGVRLVVGPGRSYTTTRTLGLVTTRHCAPAPGPGWLVLLAWPAALLLVQLLLGPAIWRSRRNYREGVLFSLASLGLCLVTAGWLAVYFVCAGMGSSISINLYLCLYIYLYLYLHPCLQRCWGTTGRRSPPRLVWWPPPPRCCC